MAEAIFNAEVKKRNLSISVDSAAIGSWHIHHPPDPRAITEALKHGLDISHYLGRQIVQKDFQDFTHILGMDHQNIDTLKKIAPSKNHDKIKLLMDYVPGPHPQEIEDPYYKDQHAFTKTWEQISLACFHLANSFEQKKT